MSVDIELELDANGATGKIGAVAASLKGLEQVANDLDIDFEADVGDITQELNDFSDALEGIEFDSSSLKNEFNDVIKEMEDTKIEMGLDTPDGSTGDGDSTGGDPPERITVKGGDLPDFSEATADGGSSGPSMSKTQLARKIESVGGFDRGSVDILGDFDASELNQLASDIEHTTKGLSSEEYPWLNTDVGDGNLGASQMPGNYHDKENPSEMDWQKLQQRASEAGVYTQNADRDTLESHLRSQQFGGKGINVDTESHGKVSLRQARRIKQGSYSTGDSERFNPSAKPSNRDLIKNTNIGKKVSNIESLDDAFKGLNGAQGGLGKRLSNLKPTMGKYMQLLAAMIPVAVGLGTQLLGVAAAMGAVGAAGAAMMGLGLLGHGESLSGSMAEAKQQVRDLKQEMFEMAQPTMQQFAPIQSRIFDAMPEGLAPVFEEMEGFKEYEDTLFELGGALSRGMTEAVVVINDNEQAISDLTTTFAGLIGSGLLDFFEWLIQSASENKQLIKELGSSIVSLAVVAYNLSMVISRLVASLRPFFKVLAWISGLLNNKLIVGLLTAITVAGLLALTFIKVGVAVYGLVSAVGSLLTFLAVLGSGSILAGITGFFSVMLGYISATIIALYEMYGAAITAATALAATGIGALIVGGGLLAGKAAMDTMTPDMPSGTGGYGGGQTIVNNNQTYNVQGTDDYAAQKNIGKEIERKQETDKAQQTPDVNSTLSTSDGE